MGFAKSESLSNLFSAAVLICGTGYFIDMFDLFAFNMVRVQSLTDLGLKGEALTQAGLLVSNCQWTGLLIGAYFSGILSDRIGRKKSLLAAIIVYSSGSLLSAFAIDGWTYGIARFITGLGLAGELGAGVTLISERYQGRLRGLGVMIFIVLGFLGVILAADMANQFPWRFVYIAGGLAGFVLILTRSFLSESQLFLQAKTDRSKRGGLQSVLSDPQLRKKYVCAIFLQLPLVFIPQVIWTLSPELAVAKGLTEPVKAQTILLAGYCCVIVSDLLAVGASEILRSRKKATLIFLVAGFPAFLWYLFAPVESTQAFVVTNYLLGLTFGIWVIAATWVAESFGTDIRGTVTTTVPNFTRAATILFNLIIAANKGVNAVTVVGIIGLTICVLSLLGWFGLQETWGRDLDFEEKSA